MKNIANSSEQALYYAFRYELAEFQSSNTQERWNIDEREKKIVEKWITSRMDEISRKLPENN